jgi:hypothetical protein
VSDQSPQRIVARGYELVVEEYAGLESTADWPRLRWLDEVLRRLPDRSREISSDRLVECVECGGDSQSGRCVDAELGRVRGGG